MEKRVKELEGDFKLIKGEVKQSLADIRELVLGGEVAPAAVPLDEAGRREVAPAREVQSIPLQPEPQYEQLEEIVDEMLPEASDQPPLEPLLPYEPQTEDEKQAPHDAFLPEDSASSEEQQEEERLQVPVEERVPVAGKEENMIAKESRSILQANQLPNLIRWVSVAKKEIGTAQLPTFLETYSVRGNLGAEMKEIILHLAAVVSEQSVEPSPADLWGRLTLELHGILSDGSNH